MNLQVSAVVTRTAFSECFFLPCHLCCNEHLSFHHFLKNYFWYFFSTAKEEDFSTSLPSFFFFLFSFLSFFPSFRLSSCLYSFLFCTNTHCFINKQYELSGRWEEWAWLFLFPPTNSEHFSELWIVLIVLVSPQSCTVQCCSLQLNFISKGKNKNKNNFLFLLKALL